MQGQFEPAVQAKLDRIARERGHPAVDLVQDAVAGYRGGVAETRHRLDTRYEDIKSGRAKLIDSEEAFSGLHERIDARRNRPNASSNSLALIVRHAARGLG